MDKAHRTKPEHGAETRAKLVSVARKMFADAGYGGVSLDGVCRRAGVTRGALYHHFQGKASLFEAVCEQVAADLTERVATTAAAEADPWIRLRAGCHAFLDACTDPEVARVLLSDAPSVLGWEAFREIDGRHGLGLLKLGIQNGIDEGVIEPGPVDTLAHVLVGALNEAAMVVARGDGSRRSRREAAEGIDRILVGLAARTPS